MSPNSVVATTTPANQEESQDRDQTDDEPFSSLLNLETDYFTEGYHLGLADGSRAGRIEGRLFGLEKGYEKALAMGRLAGRASVWERRLDLPASPTSSSPAAAASLVRPTSESLSAEGRGDGIADHDGRARGGDGDGEIESTAGSRRVRVRGLHGTERLRKHISRLNELADPESLETKNDEDAVNEFDERLAGARAKFTLISKIVREGEDGDRDGDGMGGGGTVDGGGDGEDVEAGAPGIGEEQGRDGAGEGGRDLEIDMTHALPPPASSSTPSRAGKGQAGKQKKKAGGGSGGGGGELEDFAGLPQHLLKKQPGPNAQS